MQNQRKNKDSEAEASWASFSRGRPSPPRKSPNSLQLAGGSSNSLKAFEKFQSLNQKVLRFARVPRCLRDGGCMVLAVFDVLDFLNFMRFLKCLSRLKLLRFLK